MKHILLGCLLYVFLSNLACAQRVFISPEIFTNAVTGLVFTSDEYGRVIDHQLYERDELPLETFISLSTGSADGPYHLSVMLRAQRNGAYSFVNPTTAVTFWHHSQDTLWSTLQPALPKPVSAPPVRGRFHLLITHETKSQKETLRQFGLLNFRGNKYDFETSSCWNYNLHKIGNFVNNGITNFRFGSGNENPHVFHVQSDDDDLYREILLPAYLSEKGDFVLDYNALPESAYPIGISLSEHDMSTLSVSATLMDGQELILGGNGPKCSMKSPFIRPVVSEPILNYKSRFEYYDLIDGKFVRTATRRKKVDFLDELSFEEIPFYPFDFNFSASIASLNLATGFEHWRLDFSLPRKISEPYGGKRKRLTYRYYEYYGESYRAPGNWSVIGTSSYPSGTVELPALPEGVLGMFFPGRSDETPGVYGISVTIESVEERITFSLRKKGQVSAPLVSSHVSGRN